MFVVIILQRLTIRVPIWKQMNESAIYLYLLLQSIKVMSILMNDIIFIFTKYLLHF